MDVFNASVPTVNAKDLTVIAAYNLNRLVKVPSKFGETVAADIVYKHIDFLFLHFQLVICLLFMNFSPIHWLIVWLFDLSLFSFCFL